MQRLCQQWLVLLKGGVTNIGDMCPCLSSFNINSNVVFLMLSNPKNTNLPVFFIIPKTIALCWNHCISNQRWRICPYFSIRLKRMPFLAWYWPWTLLRLDCKVMATWWALLKSQIVLLGKEEQVLSMYMQILKEKNFPYSI